MKKFLISCTFVLAFLLQSCTKQLVTNPTVNNANQGSVSLKIDKANAPNGVTLIKATLKKNGSENITKNLNLISPDSTAELSVDSIPVGEWHLEVDAENSDSEVIYAGSTDVNVVQGTVVQVYITLFPVENGTGSLSIQVSWGNTWTDNPNNPLIVPSEVPDSPNGVSHAKVIYDDGIYKMWFTSVYNSAVSNVWYATSYDGVNWKLYGDSPVLNLGNPGLWDSHSVQSSVVIKYGNGYKMYYMGFSDENGQWNIGLATSADGINWTKYSTPILYADSSENQIGPNDIIKINGTYYLYYSTRNYPYYDIRLAISQDGVNFTKYSGNPILIADKMWESTGVNNASIILDNGTYKMIYMNSSANGFGIAYSSDGKNWVKDSSNPIFKVEDINNDWCNRIAYPFWRKINGQYKVYYTGFSGNDNIGIGLITK